jgi:hypothetical protein
MAAKTRRSMTSSMDWLRLSEGTAEKFYWIGQMVMLVSGVIAVVGGITMYWGDKERQRYSDIKDQNTAWALDAIKAPRHLSEDGKKILRAALSKYAGQPFQVIQIGFDDREAQAFAGELNSAIKECGWTSSAVYAGFDEGSPIKIRSGVSVQVSYEMSATFPKEGKSIPHDLTDEVEQAMQAAGIKMAGTLVVYGSVPVKVPIETIMIYVAAKPDR